MCVVYNQPVFSISVVILCWCRLFLVLSFVGAAVVYGIGTFVLSLTVANRIVVSGTGTFALSFTGVVTLNGGC
ncbi:hypothetical protein C2G38_2198601 [Gigaspora rosea]|uniref:Uncharacterized protein n=1 Tax=Gigaspora rosea TaxID=44941 RepID=A0A397UWP2_9GLOM|nr:hypothetical protein C2G38_2198601 [Gigaspora rosea]